MFTGYFDPLLLVNGENRSEHDHLLRRPILQKQNTVVTRLSFFTLVRCETYCKRVFAFKRHTANLWTRWILFYFLTSSLIMLQKKRYLFDFFKTDFLCYIYFGYLVFLSRFVVQLMKWQIWIGKPDIITLILVLWNYYSVSWSGGVVKSLSFFLWTPKQSVALKFECKIWRLN